MVLTEAFAQGTPVVASDIAGYIDVVSHGVDGVLVPRGDATALAETGFDPSCLCLEVTESVFVQRAEAVLETLNAIRATGVRLGIDDFGTGYSSLGYLREFPVDILKIDRSFVATISLDDEVPSLIRAVLDLCRTLGLDAVAEGIEEPHQLSQLLEEHCRLGQGFLFDRPLPEDEAVALIERGDAEPAGTTPR